MFQSNEAARSLFEHAGFTLSGVKKQWIRKQEAYEDLLFSVIEYINSCILEQQFLNYAKIPICNCSHIAISSINAQSPQIKFEEYELDNG